MYGIANDGIQNEIYEIHHVSLPIYTNLPFLLIDIGVITGAPNFYEERKCSRSFFLFVTESGMGSITYNKKEIYIKQGEGILLCTDNYIFCSKSIDPWTFRWLHFDGSAAQEYLSFITKNQDCKIKLNNEVSERVFACLNTIQTEIKQNSSFIDLIVSNHITAIMTNIAVSAECIVDDRIFNKMHIEDIERVLDYIEKNYDKSISVDDLTKIACMSRYHFFRVFKSYTQKTPYEYIQNKKILEAKKLLFDSSLTIQAISHKIAYSSLNNFIKDFRKNTGSTPNKYRNMHKAAHVKDEFVQKKK